MYWSRARLYAATLVVALFLVIIGGYFVASRSPVGPSKSSLSWSGGAPPSAYQGASRQSPQQIVQEVILNPGSATLTIAPLAKPSASSTQSEPSSFNYQDFLSQLSGNASVSTSTLANNSNANALIQQAYQFIPSGLVATTAPAKKPMTAEQQALYDYGNNVGGEIQSFEEFHKDQVQVLKDQAEDRTNPVKVAALASLGQALAGVGTDLQKMQNVPSEAAPQHSALAQSYSDIGTKLQSVAEAKSDADFIQAVEAYDTSANIFVTNYAALAQFFSARGIVFAPQDPGSLFSFTDVSVAGGL